ncbi:hypothetical protein KIN20_027497 [Parelaphostrongylus tenuis]|uniref:Uncharacterized protein n=1 Tax=Parelaphostrongylus tenuis TaxID=148309 RepID=A0AAD5QZG6_PARTN|nr:hypothetical protein KIN20_027497 [Parelaphostrongylus tenuis]
MSACGDKCLLATLRLWAFINGNVNKLDETVVSSSMLPTTTFSQQQINNFNKSQFAVVSPFVA